MLTGAGLEVDFQIKPAINGAPAPNIKRRWVSGSWAIIWCGGNRRSSPHAGGGAAHQGFDEFLTEGPAYDWISAELRAELRAAVQARVAARES